MRYSLKNVCSFALSFAWGVFLLTGTLSVARGDVTTFEDVSLNGDFYNGDPGNLSPGDSYDGSFTSGGLGFNNQFNQGNGFTYWSGWSVSKVTDVTTSGFTNQYAAYHLPNGGGDGSSQYGVAFGNTASISAPGRTFQAMRVTNTTYAALSMLNGDSFAKKFGGATGNDEDFFRLTITGRQGGVNGVSTGTIDFYLADYRFADNTQDYIIDTWTTIDLTSLGNADTLTFDFASSDVGNFGINTPLYFAADNIETTIASVPEPGSVLFVGALVIGGMFRRRRTQ